MFRLNAFLACLCLSNTAYAAPEEVGMWSYAEGWTTTEFKDGTSRYCVTSSDPRKVGTVEYQILMTFGDENSFALRASTPLGSSTEGVFDLEGGGLNLGAVEYRREGGKFIAFNTVSSPMFRKVIGDFRSAREAAFELNGKRYAVPIPNGESVYEDMLACQRSLLGMVIGDLK